VQVGTELLEAMGLLEEHEVCNAAPEMGSGELDD
jgi:hypothetical protein